MGFGPEEEGGILITPMALAHPLHPIRHVRSKPRNRRRNNCGLEDVFPVADLISGPSTQFIVLCIPCIIVAFQLIEISSF